MKWLTRREEDKPAPVTRPVLIHALEGFLGAGSAASIASDQLGRAGGEVLHSFDVDSYLDYRARRPLISFHEDHYTGYERPTLDLVQKTDLAGQPYLLLAGPEPDFHWERFIDEVHDVIEEYDVGLTLGLGAVPMGVPHTRPLMITSHGTRPELVDRTNLWQARVVVPSSAQALLELRLGELGHDAAGYVVHVPHYLAQVDYPAAAIALIDAVSDRTGLSFDMASLRARNGATLADIEQQIADQDGGELLAGLEEQYDTFARGAAETLLAEDNEIPSGEELGQQFERFLANMNRRNDRD